MDTMDHPVTSEQSVQTCDICHQPILAGEKISDDGSEIAHTACVRHWFRSNYGAEGLS